MGSTIPRLSKAKLTLGTVLEQAYAGSGSQSHSPGQLAYQAFVARSSPVYRSDPVYTTVDIV